MVNPKNDNEEHNTQFNKYLFTCINHIQSLMKVLTHNITINLIYYQNKKFKHNSLQSCVSLNNLINNLPLFK